MKQEKVIDEDRLELGDMPSEEFRRFGREMVDWIADYLAHPERVPVLSKVKPGYLKNALPESAPRQGEPMEQILADLDRFILPGVTHWNHPSFFAYFSVSGSGPGILGEMLSAAFNVNAMLWRTSPAATELEEVTLNWLRRMIGLPENFSGVIYDTASISTLCAIAAAREAVTGIDVREKGLAYSAGDEQGARAGIVSAPPRLRLYANEHAHSSVDKAAITLGLGLESMRKIGTDSEFRMDYRALERAIEEDREQGWLPFCVVATVGTTSVTSVDPVDRIADICERNGLWLHVDAAYGGSAAVVPEMRYLMEGCERADSLVMNPHKWLFVPIDLSALYTRRMDVLRRAFSLVPEYLRTTDSDEVQNFMDYGPQLGRRFRALKLWFVLRYFGEEGIAARIRYHMRLAREFATWVEESEDFELLAPVPLSLVCFRASPAAWRTDETRLEQLNARLLDEVNREGRVFLSHTKLNGRFALRLAIGNIRTTHDHVKMAWDELNAVLARIRDA
ncbi:MAG TPA: pyridoxal-dependent decarboxylase [Blastocatellia bacterium]